MFELCRDRQHSSLYKLRVELLIYASNTQEAECPSAEAENGFGADTRSLVR
jgi:hypothetical protein